MPLDLRSEPQPCDARTICSRYAQLIGKGFLLNSGTHYWERVDSCLSDSAVRYVDDETWLLLLPKNGA